jgi:succinylglutamate desuccinylase
LDLHSTSAGGVPFATIGDTLRNRRFALKLPVVILLGIEEQLEGTMLEFLNNEGTVTLGFEGGQHAANESVDNHEALVIQALVAAEILSSNDVPDISQLRGRLELASGKRRVFEVRHREPVSTDDEFLMNPGFDNFDPVRRGQALATCRHGIVKAPESGLILMPLYQKLGEDGFFIVRRVAPFWLRVSEIVRRFNLADYVHLLPGVRRRPKHPETLHIDTRIARFFPLQIFHLLGFRRLRWQKNFLVVSRRRYDTASPFKSRTSWTRGNNW